MVIQIINISIPEVFKSYSSHYKIYREVYQQDLRGLELRNVPPELAKVVQKIVLKEKEICYKNETGKNGINLFIPGSLWNIKEISRRILSYGDEDLGYRIINVIKNHEEYEAGSYRIGARDFSSNNAYVMGILNVTPDSFSDGGKYIEAGPAIKRGLEMLEEGADIIDIGGESTRPGAEVVDEQNEIKRIVPVIQGILKVRPDAVISADTTKKNVAREALESGAKIINDISALTFEPDIGELVKKHDAALVLMHMKGTPKDMQKEPYYDDPVSEIYDFLNEKIQNCARIGIKKLFIDPGIGFGKRVSDNFDLIKRLEDFKGLGYPILIGVSRKSFLGKTLDLNVEERDTATAAAEAVAVKNGARVIRTHNVKNGVQVCKLLNHLT